MRSLTLLFAILASLSASVPAQAIEHLGRLDYRVISQTGATIEADGLWTISARPGDLIALSLTIEPRPTRSDGTVLYPLAGIIREKGVPNAHCVELQTIGADNSLDAWLDPATFDYTYEDGIRALGQYNGEPVNAGDLTKEPRLTLDFTLQISSGAKPGEHLLNLRVERVYDGARMVDDQGLPMEDGSSLSWKVNVQDPEEKTVPAAGDVGLLMTQEDEAMQVVMLTAVMTEPLKALVSLVGQDFLRSHSHFTATPLYDSPADDPISFWGILYMFDEADGSVAVFLQRNEPDQNYPVRTMFMPVSLDMTGTSFADDRLQLEVAPIQASQ